MSTIKGTDKWQTVSIVFLIRELVTSSSPFGTSKINLSDQQIGLKLASIFDMRPYAIEQRLKLRNPIYLETSAYGHMGRKPQIINKTFDSEHSGKIVKEVELFTWEKLDFISKIKKTFKL